MNMALKCSNRIGTMLKPDAARQFSKSVDYLGDLLAPLVLAFLGFDCYGPSTIYNSVYNVYNGVLETSPMFLIVLPWEYEHLKEGLSFFWSYFPESPSHLA